MNPDVREAGPDDAAGIAEAHVLSWQACYRGQIPDEVLDNLVVADRAKQWAAAFEEGSGADGVFVGEVDGRIVGFSSCGPARGDQALPGAGDLSSIYLLPEWWGRGLGFELHDAAIGRMRERGYPMAMLWVLTANDRARRFYEKQGWRWAGYEKLYQGDGFDIPELRYEREL
jgi:GNAT superfamily N-acetyltransferase